MASEAPRVRIMSTPYLGYSYNIKIPFTIETLRDLKHVQSFFFLFPKATFARKLQHNTIH